MSSPDNPYTMHGTEHPPAAPELTLQKFSVEHDGHTYHAEATWTGAEAVQALAAAFGEALEEHCAPNYLETRCLWHPEGKDPVPLVVTVQRVWGKTPHEKREEAEAALREAEAERDELRKALIEYGTHCLDSGWHHLGTEVLRRAGVTEATCAS